MSNFFIYLEVPVEATGSLSEMHFILVFARQFVTSQYIPK